MIVVSNTTPIFSLYKNRYNVPADFTKSLQDINFAGSLYYTRITFDKLL